MRPALQPTRTVRAGSPNPSCIDSSAYVSINSSPSARATQLYSPFGTPTPHFLILIVIYMFKLGSGCDNRNNSNTFVVDMRLNQDDFPYRSFSSSSCTYQLTCTNITDRSQSLSSISDDFPFIRSVLTNTRKERT